MRPGHRLESRLWTSDPSRGRRCHESRSLLAQFHLRVMDSISPPDQCGGSSVSVLARAACQGCHRRQGALAVQFQPPATMIRSRRLNACGYGRAVRYATSVSMSRPGAVSLKSVSARRFGLYGGVVLPAVGRGDEPCLLLTDLNAERIKPGVFDQLIAETCRRTVGHGPSRQSSNTGPPPQDLADRWAVAEPVAVIPPSALEVR